MKKTLIGMVAGAWVLAVTVVPAVAGGAYETGDNTLWTIIDSAETGGCGEEKEPFTDDIDVFVQLVLIGGWAHRLDSSGNGEPSYTVFAPDSGVILGVLDSMKLDLSDLSDQPDLVNSILADHIANGTFNSDELENSNLTRIMMRSGYVATVFGEHDPLNRTVGEDVYIAGAFIFGGEQFDNGWLYLLCGFINSTPQVSTEGLNALDTPKDGTPGGTNTLLPNTL